MYAHDEGNTSHVALIVNLAGRRVEQGSRAALVTDEHCLVRVHVAKEYIPTTEFIGNTLVVA
jgi:hypothetical protein